MSDLVGIQIVGFLMHKLKLETSLNMEAPVKFVLKYLLLNVYENALLMRLNPGPEVIKLFSCSIQLSMKFKLLKINKHNDSSSID